MHLPIYIGGYDKAFLLVALYNRAHPRVFGRPLTADAWDYIFAPMSYERATDIVQNTPHVGTVKTRVLNVDLRSNWLFIDDYEEYNGSGAALLAIDDLEWALETHAINKAKEHDANRRDV